jgi:hypothetical protein
MFFSRARGTKAAPLPVQVGDRVFSALGQIYTGTGSTTADGIAGWTPTANTSAISIDVTELPTSNTGLYGSRIRLAASNATSNTTVLMDFNNDGTLQTPKLFVTDTSNLGPVTNVTITGGSNGQVLSTDGTGNLSFTNTVGSAAVADVALSVDGANVSGQVFSAASADIALSVNGANVSGQVANAAVADSALGVSRNNVSGAGNIGQIQFANASGNLTSSERYYISGSGNTATGAFTASRDSAGGGFVAVQYANSFSSHFVTGKARGNKAAPLPVQVGDSFGGIGFLPYTGNGTTTLDGITGFTPTGAGISTTLTAQPTANGNLASMRLNFYVTNAASNTTVASTFNDDGTLSTPRLNAYGNVPSNIRSIILGGQAPVFSSTLAPDVALGTRFAYTLTSDFTFNGFTNPIPGQTAEILMIQDGVGGRVMSSTMLFAGGDKTLSTLPGVMDRMSIYYDGASYFAQLSKNYS